MIRQFNLEDQSLVIEVKATPISILEVATIHEAILRDEIIIAQAEHKPLVVVPKQAVNGNHAYAFPLLIQKAGVLRAAIVDAEAIELGAEVLLVLELVR
jgi:hypothetical protein